MKVALTTEGIYPFQIGGIQKHSYLLAKGLAGKKIYVDIYQTSNADIEILKNHFTEAELKYLNFLFIEFPQLAAFPGHYVYASYIFSKRLYQKINREEKYNAIYAQGFTSWFFLKKKVFHKNLITNLHGLEMFQASINIKQRLRQLLLKIPAKEIIKASTKQVSLGGKLTNIHYKVGAKENTVVEIPNAIAAAWIMGSDNIKKPDKAKLLHLVFIGRYERRKGIEEFQEVITQTVDVLDYKVSLIGPIPKEKQIQKSDVNYLGLVKESEKIRTILKQADILVCPSYSEGMPTVILEAMACGCAIIATDVGAVNTMVNKDNGWLIQGDIKDGLLKTIAEAVKLSEEDLYKKKLNSLAKVSSLFTWDIITEQTLKQISLINSN